MAWTPLNPPLYRSLTAACRQVIVANPGIKVQFIADMKFGKPYARRLSTGEAYRICCSKCGDTNFHLWISYTFGMTNPITGKRTWIARCFRHNEPVKDHVRSLTEWQKSATSPEDAPTFDDVIVSTGRPGDDICPVIPPGDVLRLDVVSDDPRMLAAHAYLLDRGIDPADAGRQFGLAVCLSENHSLWYGHGLLDGSLIIPAYQNGVMVGWQRRLIADPPEGYPKPGCLRYLSMPGAWVGRSLFGYDALQDRNLCVVVEGPMDAAKHGPGFVAQFGRSVKYAQALLLAEKFNDPDKVVIVLGDSPEKGLEKYPPEKQDVERELQRKSIQRSRELLESQLNATVIAPELPYEDPGAWSRIDLVDWLRESVGDILGAKARDRVSAS